MEKYEQFAAEMEAAYPEMFSQPYGGFAVGEGWYPVLRSLCFHINSHEEWAIKNRERDIVYNEMLQEAIDGNRTRMLEYFKWSGDQEGDVDAAIEQGLRIIKDLPARVTVAQIKEKFGGLRFYYDGGDEYISGLVTMAESWADKTCEVCGDAGQLRNGGWVRTLCDTHEEEYQKNKAK